MNAPTSKGVPLNPDGFPNGSSRKGIRWNEAATFDFERWKWLFVRNRLLMGAIVAGCLVAMWVFAKSQPKIYASRAAIQVEQQQPKVLNKVEAINEGKLDAEDYVKTVVELLSSNSLMLEVVKANGLDKDPSFAPPKLFGAPYLDSELAARMQRKVNVSQRHASRVVDVTVEDPNPAMAAKLANSVVNEFLRQTVDQNASASTAASQFLFQQAEELKKKLEAAELKLQQYREQEQAVSLEQSQNITVEKLKDLNAKVTAARSERLRLEADLNQVRAAGANDTGRLLQIGSVASLPQVAEIRTQLIKAQSEFATVSKRYLDRHPKYIAALTQVNDLKRSLADAVLRSGETIGRQYQAAIDLENSLGSALKEQEAKALDLDKISGPYHVLSREAESERVMYDTVITRMKETGVTKGIDLAPYRIVETAMEQSVPVRPHTKMLMLVAFFGGIALAIGVVMLKDMLDTTVHTVDQAESRFGLDVLAAVPEQKKNGKGIEFLENPRSPQAEAIRSLRASLLGLAKKDEPQRLHVIASAVPLEGKTTISLNLAGAFARQGLRTLVIDADLRRPQVSELLANASKEPVRGLTDYLCGRADLDHIIHTLDSNSLYSNLYILPAGWPVPNPAEILAQPAFLELVAKLRQKFDRIVIDTAPITAVSDTLAFAGNMGGVCLVIRAGKTPSQAIQVAKDQLVKAGAAIDGVIINWMAPGDVPYYARRYGEEGRDKRVFSSAPEKKVEVPRAKL